MPKLWKDLFGEKQLAKQSNCDIINDNLKSLNSIMYIKETIPQSVIKKSRKDAYKKT
jgi:hypothetical protein